MGCVRKCKSSRICIFVLHCDAYINDKCDGIKMENPVPALAYSYLIVPRDSPD